MNGKQQVENASFLFIIFRFILFLAKVGQMQSEKFPFFSLSLSFIFFRLSSPRVFMTFLHEKLFSVSDPKPRKLF